MPYGGTTKEQDKKIEKCVQSLMKKEEFKPKKGQTKKEAAIAVCKDSVLRSSKK